MLNIEYHTILVKNYEEGIHEENDANLYKNYVKVPKKGENSCQYCLGNSYFKFKDNRYEVKQSSHEFSDLGSDAILVGTAHLSNFIAALVELEGGHGLDAYVLRGLLVGINVDLDEDGVGELFLHSNEFGADHLAGRAPGGSEVNDNELVTGRGKALIVFSFVSEELHFVVVIFINYNLRRLSPFYIEQIEMSE